jgi:hypothetical protein
MHGSHVASPAADIHPVHVWRKRKDEHPDRRQFLPVCLELNVRTELTLAESSQPWEEAVRVPIGEWLSDPADDQRYEVGLRSLLGAVEALEDGSSRGDDPSLVRCRRAS